MESEVNLGVGGNGLYKVFEADLRGRCMGFRLSSCYRCDS